MELFAIRIGATQLLVLARLSTSDDLSGAQVERLLVALRAQVRARHPEVTETFIEVNPGGAAAGVPTA